MDIGMVLGLIVSGAIIGALARLLVPGRNPIGLIATLLVGIVGAVLGGYLGDLIEAADWISWVFGIVIAAVLVALLSLPASRRRQRSLHR